MKYEEKKLSELVDTISDTRKIDKDKVVLVNTSDVLAGEVLNHTYTENCNLRGQFKKRFKTDDILYSEIRPANKRFAYIDFDSEDYIASTKLMVLRRKSDKITNKYLYYCLTNDLFVDRMQHLAEARSGTFPQITFDVLKGETIYLPSIANQNKITSILDNINNKIRLNNEINNNLHELVKNEYYERFIVNKRDDWKEDTLGNYLSIDRGLSYKGQFLSDNGVPMINLGNVMPNGVFRIEKNKYYSGDFKEKVTTKVGDIVLANTDMTQNREVIGTPVIVPPIYDGKIIFSHHIYCLRDLKLPKMFIFYTLLTDDWNAAAGGNATGTTVLALPKNTIENYIITIPDNESLAIFDNIATSIQEKRELIMLENIKLEELRDTLLPKLMNGEIDLDNIEI